MLGFDRHAARWTWTVALTLLLLILFFLVRKTLFVFVLAILFAYLLSPLVNLLDRVLPASRTRTPALTLSYILVVGGLVVAVIQIGSRVVDQANALAKTIPALLQQWEQPTPGATPAENSLKAQALAAVREQIAESSNELLGALPKAGLKVLSVASDLIYIVVVPILSFFFLKDGRTIRDHAVELIAIGPQRELLEDVMADVNVLLAQYMRALFFLCTATFISYSIFFSILNMPYAILLGALAFGLEFIPMIGPLTASIVILLVAGLSGSHVAAVLIFLLVYRVFQDYVLSPHLMGSGVELHPLVVLFGVFAGAEIAGVPGAFLSVPVLALVRIFYRRLTKARQEARLSPTPSV